MRECVSESPQCLFMFQIFLGTILLDSVQVNKTVVEIS